MRGAITTTKCKDSPPQAHRKKLGFGKAIPRSTAVLWCPWHELGLFRQPAWPYPKTLKKGDGDMILIDTGRAGSMAIIPDITPLLWVSRADQAPQRATSWNFWEKGGRSRRASPRSQAQANRWRRGIIDQP